MRNRIVSCGTIGKSCICDPIFNCDVFEKDWIKELKWGNKKYKELK